jgi:hypothetical protein
MTRTPIARQRLGKDIPARANERKNRRSVARQPISEHTLLTIEAVFSVGSVRSGYKEVSGSVEQDRRGVVGSRMESS